MQSLSYIFDRAFFESALNWLTNQGFEILLICAVSFGLYKIVHLFVKHVVKRTIRSSKANPIPKAELEKRRNTVTGLAITIVRIFVIMVAGLAIFKILFPTVNFTALFAGAGIVGIVLAFGAQSLLKDFMTGLFIISENQYRVGDVVDLDNGAAGTVERIGVRSTVLRDANGNVHYVPNGSIGHVINKTMGYSKVNFTLSVHPDSDVDLVAQVINETGLKLAADPKWSDKITEAPQFVNIGNFSQLGMDVVINGVTEPSEQWSVTGELRRRLLKQFAKHKIQLATAATPWPSAPKKK
jgi:small conductance mechanosensitive channel